MKYKLLKDIQNFGYTIKAGAILEMGAATFTSFPAGALEEIIEYPCAHGRDSRGPCDDCRNVETVVQNEPVFTAKEPSEGVCKHENAKREGGFLMCECGACRGVKEPEGLLPSEWMKNWRAKNAVSVSFNPRLTLPINASFEEAIFALLDKVLPRIKD